MLVKCLREKQNNTWLLRGMEFLLSRSIRCLTRSLRSLVRYQVEHSKRNSISLHAHALFPLDQTREIDINAIFYRCTLVYAPRFPPPIVKITRMANWNRRWPTWVTWDSLHPQLLLTITRKVRRGKIWWTFLRNSNMFKDSVKYLEFDLCINFVMRRWDKYRFPLLLSSEMHLLTLMSFSYLVIHFSYFLLLYFLVFCC